MQQSPPQPPSYLPTRQSTHPAEVPSNAPLWIFGLTCLFYCIYRVFAILRESNAITADLEAAEQARTRITEMEGEADLERSTKNEEWELREVVLRERSGSSSRMGSPENGGKMEVAIRFEERGDGGGKMD
jgi:hypothetical protein